MFPQYGLLLKKLERSRLAIIDLAESLRPGHHCILVLPPDSLTILDNERSYGAINIHFPLEFDDGVKWLLRVRQAHHGVPPIEILKQTAISEVVTLQTLRSFGMPVPQGWIPIKTRVEDEGGDLFEDTSICYFFCEFMAGKSQLMPHLTLQTYREVVDHDRRLIEEYGRSQILLSKHPIKYTLIGSLVPSNGHNDSVSVGPLLSLWGVNNIQAPHFPGPFTSNRQRYLTQIDIVLSHISEGVMNDNDALNAYLWHLTLKELVETCPELAEGVTKVYVRHADAKGDILWGDDEGNLTAILDWGMAFVTTKAEAFSSPLFCYHTNASYERQDLHTVREKVLIDFYDRSNRPDLAHCVRKGKKYQYLESIGRFHGWYVMICMPMALMDAFEDTKPQSLQPPFYADKDWTVYMVQRYIDNPELQTLISKIGWDLEEERKKVISSRGWEERDRKRSEWWALSAENRRRRKSEDVVAREKAMAENRLRIALKKQKKMDEGATGGMEVKSRVKKITKSHDDTPVTFEEKGPNGPAKSS
ncbi:hypothetical protein L486_05561 [Kwoniella mangroviensis CBS 10435]|uniref:Aminoglycoside phosphotransferase domain-containing protein n=1 Tax=Kwoniella mangroviensis CBS 10435 TaxID=1331196 RepID=A0A1B9IMF7_9TREE|nr:hypothetical protein L486_05561 [Kwoniella mangroviensis CBS 10435]